MYRTLSDLRNRIDQLIAEQGEDAAVAAFVFTKNDVFYFDEENFGKENTFEEYYLNAEDTDRVLLELGGCDYIYEQVNEIISDEVRRVRNKVAV